MVGLGDIVFDKQTISSKRMEKMSDRTGAWTRTLAEACRDSEQNRTAPPHIFAPILPIASQLQSYYTNQLLDDDTLRDSVQGLAMYDAGSVLDLPKQSSALPRLMLTESPGPAKLLQEVSLGADLFVIPFIGAATDAGIALGFQFPPPSAVNGNARRPLGMDMWQSEHALDLSPLAPYCECYSCKKHHRAYLYHLLSTKEMLAWVLLQIHNHHILDRFFAGVRDSIAKETFEKDKHAFEKFYEPELPEKTGQGPRLRGYQVKSEGRGEPKKNPKAYGRLDDAQVKFAEGVAPSLDVDGVDLEKDGLASVIE